MSSATTRLDRSAPEGSATLHLHAQLLINGLRYAGVVTPCATGLRLRLWLRTAPSGQVNAVVVDNGSVLDTAILNCDGDPLVALPC
jgi:hypothetical protein